jgi:hypothetical protein
MIYKLNFFLLLLLILNSIFIGSLNAQDRIPNSDSKVSSNVLTNFPVTEFFSSVQIHSIASDQRGLAYFAYSSGIAEFDGVEWRSISVPDSVQVYDLSTNKDGRIYAAGRNQIGYLFVDGNGHTKYHSISDTSSTKIRDTFFKIVAIDGLLYFVGTKNLYRYHNNELSIVSKGSFIAASNLQDVLIVNDQERGLLYLEELELLPIAQAEFIRATDMKPLNKDQLLMSTRSSGLQILSFLNNSIRIEPWDSNISEYIDVTSISSIDVFKNELVAVGSYSEGVTILDVSGKVIDRFSSANELQNNNVFDVFFTSKATIWVGLNEGVALINTPLIYPNISIDYSAVDTLSLQELSDSTTFENDNSGWFSRNVSKIKIWFTEEDEEITSSPEEAQNLFASIVRKVEYIPNDSLIFGGAFSQTELGVQALQQADTLKYEFPFDFNAFRFSYATNKYEDIGSIQYQVMLDGLDRGWSTWSDNTYREYTNLDWGDYTFIVRAKNADAQVSTEAKFSFSIIPPWYESTWFYLIQFGSLFLALVVSGILNKAGKAISLSEALIAVVVIVIFQYVDFYIDPYLDEYSNDIAVFKIIISIIFGFSLEFIEETFHKIIAKLTGLSEKAEVTEQAQS